MSKALIHVKNVRRPISQEVIAFRLEAAHPNMAGRVMRARHEGGEVASFYATQQAAPSFRRPYLIQEGTDHPWIDRRKVEQFMKDLSFLGFKEFELVGNYNGDPLAEVMLHD